MTPNDYPPETFEDPLSNYDPPAYSDPVAEALAERPVTEMRLQPFAEIAPDATVEAAVQVLATLGASSLLVIEDGQLVGIFTERDVLCRAAEQFAKVRKLPVASIMTSNPVVIHDNDPAAAALAAIAASGYRHVPVLDQEERVVGVASPRRVFRFLQAHLAQA